MDRLVPLQNLPFFISPLFDTKYVIEHLFIFTHVISTALFFFFFFSWLNAQNWTASDFLH